MWGQRAAGSNSELSVAARGGEKAMATHSSVLAWRIPGTGEPGGLPSMGSHRVRHDLSDLVAAAAAAAAAAVHRYQKGLEQSGRITQVTVKQYFST